MKRSLLSLVLLATTVSAAPAVFPGLKSVLSDAEWKRAGLDRLSPDQVGVIDAALIRYEAGLERQHQAEVAAVRQDAAAAAATAQPKASLFARFGLPNLHDDWRSLPTLTAKVMRWDGGNRFVLDNGQVWQGDEPITYDLPGKDVAIQPRPHGQFALVVDGVNTTLRVSRVR